MAGFTNLPALRVPKVVFGLTFFWGAVLWSFDVVGPYHPGFFVTWTAAVLAGVWVGEIHSNRFHEEIMEDLRYQFMSGLPKTDAKAFYNEERGVYSLLGPVPFHKHSLERLSLDNSELINALDPHCPPELEIERLAFITNYLEQYAESHPGHVALFSALLKIYLHPNQSSYPAGFNSIHGGRSLLSHSLLVCAMAHRDAGEFTYELPYGLEPINQNYKLDPKDPLIPIIAFAHDIGKYECMIFDEDGQAVGISPNHDIVGSRLMAMIDEYWDERIDHEDRRILQMVLGFYHHPSDMPVERIAGKRPIIRVSSDRLHGLLELLIHADTVAGQLEMGMSHKIAKQKTKNALEKIQTGNLDTLLNSFFSHLAIKASINSRGAGIRSTAFKLQDQEHTQGRVYLYFDEHVWRQEFMSYLGGNEDEFDDAKNKIHAVTNAVLKQLDEQGYLVDLMRKPGDVVAIGKSKSLKNMVYSIEFEDPDTKEVSVRFKTAFVVDITSNERLKDLASKPNCHSRPVSVKPRFGLRGNTRSATDVLAEAKLLGASPLAIGVGAETLELKPSFVLLQKAKRELGDFFDRVSRKNADMHDIHRTLACANIIGPLDHESGQKVWAIKGIDDYFVESGFDLNYLTTHAETYRRLDFLEVRPSSAKPGTHVWIVRLERLGQV